MDQNELRKRSEIFQDSAFAITLHSASARKEDDCHDEGPDTHALDTTYKSADIGCINFDELKLAKYPTTQGKNTPCSVDALLFEHAGTYLIEFKFRTALMENITRKVYDSVMLMVEHGGYTYSQARTELSYLVVSTGITNRIGGRDRALGRSYGYCKEPWIKFRNSDDHWKVASLEGVIVKEAYCMHPATFDYYAKLKCWK